MLDARFLSFAGALIALAFTASSVGSQGPSDKPIEQLLSQVPNGAAWQDLDQGLRAAFEMRASSVLAQDRQSWGLAGLQQKETLLLSAPTPAMTENIDLILSVTYASELPGGFKMARDVKNAELKRLLIRIYLAITDDRGFMLSNHPEFKGWDGMPVKELQLLDHQHYMEMGTWQRQTEEGLRKIPDSELTSLEKGLRSKSYFTTRAGKYFDRPAVALNGSMGYSSLYAFPIDRRPFPSDEALLNAYNASMSTNFREVNMGTLDAFMFDYESEFNREWLKNQGMSETLTDNILKLGHLFRTRVQALPDKSKRCTIYSSSERDATWDAFTAGQLSNADGSETMQSYAKLFGNIAAQRAAVMQAVGRLTLERLFPDGSSEVTPDQRKRVADKLLHEMRPAMMMETLLSALDEVTGSPAASMKVKDAIEKQPTV